MLQTNQNATGGRTVGGDMDTREQSSNDERQLESLAVTLELEGSLFVRRVWPAGNAKVADLLAAMREDEQFLNLTMHDGELVQVDEGGRHILLGRYEVQDYESLLNPAEIVEVSAHYDDDTTIEVPVG